MAPRLFVSLDGLPQQASAPLLRDFVNSVARIGVAAEIQSAPSQPRQRSDATLLSQLALGLVTGGSVVAFINCIKSYISRNKEIKFKISRDSGLIIEVSAQNINDPKIIDLLSSIISDDNSSR